MPRSHALDGRVVPVSPLWYAAGRALLIECKCGRRGRLKVNDLLHRPGVSRDLRIWEVEARLRCAPPEGCGGRPQVAGTT